jgi:hypothetical protein
LASLRVTLARMRRVFGERKRSFQLVQCLGPALHRQELNAGP